MLNSKVNSYIVAQVRDGVISGSDAQAIAAASTNSGLTSLGSIDALPGPVQTVVRDAFRQGSRFAFISLIPWCALALITSLFLRNITEEDRQEHRGQAQEPPAPQSDKEKEPHSEGMSATPKLEDPSTISEHDVHDTLSKV